MPPDLKQILEAFIICIPPALRPHGKTGSFHCDACCPEPFPENAFPSNAVVVDVVDCQIAAAKNLGDTAKLRDKIVIA
jgi:hypothetical protein